MLQTEWLLPLDSVITFSFSFDNDNFLRVIGVAFIVSKVKCNAQNIASRWKTLSFFGGETNTASNLLKLISYLCPTYQKKTCAASLLWLPSTTKVKINTSSLTTLHSVEVNGKNTLTQLYHGSSYKACPQTHTQKDITGKGWSAD